MKEHLVFTVIQVLLAIFFTQYASATDRSGPPNVVFILADDLGWTDLSSYGSKYHQTPNIDALAERGVLFTAAYAANYLCSPTRASIITGRWPSRIGITQPACHVPEIILKQELIKDAKKQQKALDANCVTRLDTSYPSVAKCFKEAGYVTGHIGKWHLGSEPYSPLEHGFDVDIPHSDHPSPMGNGWFFPWPTWPKQGKPGDYLEDRMAEEAVGFIRKNAGKPFYLHYWMWSVHGPYQARKELIEKYEKLADPKSLHRHPVYAAMMEHMDKAVGAVVAELERQKLMDNTIIVFTSDNGPIANEKTNKHMPAGYKDIPVTSALPLRGGKGTVYEGGTRVPLIVIWPGVTKPKSRNTQAIVQSIDFFPTLAEMCGVDASKYGPFDGESFASTLRGEKFARDTIFAHFPHCNTKNVPTTYVRKGDWKLLRFYCDNEDQSDRIELYNLAKDIGETHDLSREHPEMAATLNGLIDEWLKHSGAVVPVANPNYVRK